MVRRADRGKRKEQAGLVRKIHRGRWSRFPSPRAEKDSFGRVMKKGSLVGEMPENW
jgi:hypothetical protein